NFQFPGNFLAQDLTRQLYKEVQYMPSDVIDRGSLRSWRQKGNQDVFTRARIRVDNLIASYQPPELSPGVKDELQKIVS
ncbi:MAG: hypothetical protein GWN00_39355, partial [Aliifodinibius sp.]|nr:hypothetical protein [Fodinibius sp.]NIW40811.1 hypothetical protein [candidate division Zixibacteria bacterium]NIY30621.1 hypothetical protein [Fodinibius sp.]